MWNPYATSSQRHNYDPNTSDPTQEIDSTYKNQSEISVPDKRSDERCDFPSVSTSWIHETTDFGNVTAALTTLCKHARSPGICKTCRRYCEHGRVRYSCKECGGKSICEHGRQRYVCKDCGGQGVCEHGRQRNSCKDCGGTSICSHGRNSYDCRDCGAKGFCEHGRKRYHCKECGGKAICEHNLHRSTCKECVSVDKMLASTRWCQGCLSTQLSKARIRTGIRVCAQCDPTVPDRIEKIVMPMFVKEIGFPASSLNNVRVGGKECDAGKRVPDACWISADRVVFLEIDEHGHKDRLPACEVAKVIDQTLSVQKEYENAIVVHFRFNPCEFDHHRISLDDRIAKTASDIRLFLSGAGQWRTEVPYVLYYYYPQKSYFQIEHVLTNASEALSVMVVEENTFRPARNFTDVNASWTTSEEPDD
jgi:hypothetical protein